MYYCSKPKCCKQATHMMSLGPISEYVCDYHAAECKKTMKHIYIRSIVSGNKQA